MRLVPSLHFFYDGELLEWWLKGRCCVLDDVCITMRSVSSRLLAEDERIFQRFRSILFGNLFCTLEETLFDCLSV